MLLEHFPKQKNKNTKWKEHMEKNGTERDREKVKDMRKRQRIILLHGVVVHFRFTFSIMTRSTMQLNLIWYRWDSILFYSSIYVLLSSFFLLTLRCYTHMYRYNIVIPHVVCWWWCKQRDERKPALIYELNKRRMGKKIRKQNREENIGNDVLVDAPKIYLNAVCKNRLTSLWNHIHFTLC